MKKLVIVLFIFLCLPGIVRAEETLAENAKSAILIEASTGKIIYEKNSHEKLAPASMTKIASMLVIIEAIEDGVISWNDVITVSENASSMGGSQILLETGEKMTVSDLFKGVAVASGNDAVVALAEAVAGSEKEFVKMMNDKVKELNLKDTNFKNPHGLDTADHYSSAHDMAILAKELVKHTKVLEFTSIYEDYLRKGTNREFWLVNTNKLVRFNEIVDGLKTGYTKEAGYCLTATAFKNDMRLIATVMGEKEATTRNSDVTSLLDYGYAKIKINKILTTKDVVAKVKIDKAEINEVEIIPSRDINIVTDKSKKIGDITYKLKTDTIKVPTKKGSNVGYLEIYEDGKKIETVDLVVKKDIKKVGLLKLYTRYLKDIVSGDIRF